MSTLETTYDEKQALSDIFKKYTKHWKWFLLSVSFAIFLALVYLRYTTPLYSATAKIQVLDEKAASSELSVFRELEIFTGGNKTKVQDEIDIIKSRSNFIQVIKHLKINKKISLLGNISNSELYKNSPINLSFVATDSTLAKANIKFFIRIEEDNLIQFKKKEKADYKSYPFGKEIITPIGGVVVTPNENYKEYFGKSLLVELKPIFQVAQYYMQKTKISMKDELSNVLTIKLSDPNQQKSIEILNDLIETYNANAVQDRKAIADKTSEFIDERITDIYSNLSSVDQSAEDFRTNRGIADISSQANINLNASAVGEQELRDANIQLSIAASMRDLIETQNGHDIIPPNIGLSDQSISNAANTYNQLVAERNRLLRSSNKKNPVIVNLDQQLDALKKGMRSSLNSMENNLNLKVNNLSKQLSTVNSRIYSAPKNERVLRDITRKQQTTESLYLYLLQKREEAQISFASSAPKSKIIDWAFPTSEFPVSPKTNIVLLAAIILGLFVPFAFIYSRDLIDSKVDNKASLEKFILNTPIIGELPKLKKNQLKIVNNKDRSVLSESLRIVRTNLDFLIKSKKGDSKNNIIFVTSSVPGEGKTFVSYNLSLILSSTKNKVLLIGADIRNPKLHSSIQDAENNKQNKPKNIPITKRIKNDFGLSEYLIDDSIRLKDIISPIEFQSNSIDVVYSGKIPPNPTELLMNNRIKELFEEANDSYDYVIVDTAPLMVVSDTLLISGYANETIYVVRSGVTERSALQFPLKLQKEGKLNGLVFLVNGVRQANLGYGGKYGYGYGDNNKPWWSKKIKYKPTS